MTGWEGPDGIYRVVGTQDEAVTLLQVGDAHGRRVHTGELVTIPTDEFEKAPPAGNPDGNRPLGTVVKSRLEMIYWSVRAFVQQLISHPVPAAIAVTLLGLGTNGEQLISLPEPVQGTLIIVGSLNLAYIGSSRL